MIDPAKTPLHELLEICANKARVRLGTDKADAYLLMAIEAAARYAEGDYDGKAGEMFHAASELLEAADRLYAETEEPSNPATGDWEREEGFARNVKAVL